MTPENQPYYQEDCAEGGMTHEAQTIHFYLDEGAEPLPFTGPMEKTHQIVKGEVKTLCPVCGRVDLTETTKVVPIDQPTM